MYCLDSAGNLQLFGELLSDLRWLLSSVQNGAIYAILGLYKNSDYRSKVPQCVSV